MLAKLLNQLGHADLAAQQAELALNETQDEDTFGEALRRHVIYLFVAKSYGKVVNLVLACPEYKRMKSRLWHIRLLSWESHRRLDQAEEAQKLHKMFMAQFHRHPLPRRCI